ncbi:PDZ domain-containing protein [Candidatus Parcubacteria bacterium]|nr:PDZ domain-containing protein [Candidatus Parcubacteria bacterium]
MLNNKYQNLIIIFFVSIVGFLAGSLGALVVENYRFDHSNQDLPKQISIFKQSDKIIEDTSMDLLRKNIVGIILKKENPLNILAAYYSPEDIIAYGFILTGDGWIVSIDNKNFHNKENIKKLAIITNSGDILQIEKQEIDSVSGAVFLKVDNPKKEFLAMKLGDSRKLNLMDELASIDLYGSAVKHSVVNLKKTGAIIQSSEKIGNRMIMSQSSAVGLPLINFNNEIMGIIDYAGGNFIKAIPINYFKNQISQILKTGKPSRIFLGVNYINLSKFPKNELSKNFISGSSGALIYSLDKNMAVIKGSPADIAGLKHEDIIISIEEEEISANKDLSEIIQEYKQNINVNMEILRRGEKKEIEVGLAELE